MIYVLFGPPGVGKTYIGNLAAKKLKIRFFDADVLFDESLRRLIRDNKFRQIDRDRFFSKLEKVTEHLLSELQEGEDLLLAQAFIKNKNRNDFLDRFDHQVKYILVKANKTLAFDRVHTRDDEDFSHSLHVIDSSLFNYVWDEFEEPKIDHEVMFNMNQDDDELYRQLRNLLE